MADAVVAAIAVLLTLSALAAQGPQGTAILRGRVVDAVNGRQLQRFRLVVRAAGRQRRSRSRHDRNRPAG
jgi:hypothetical protein